MTNRARKPNLQYELDQYANQSGVNVTFSREAREAFLAFAVSREAKWSANFRDLNAAINRMATMAEGGRITLKIVKDEIQRLSDHWEEKQVFADSAQQQLQRMMGPERYSKLDRFDRVQLADVVEVCRKSKSLSEAGRVLFSETRKEKRTNNDSDRIRKYLLGFGIEWSALQA